MKRLLLLGFTAFALTDIAYAQENVTIEEHQEEMDTAEFSNLVERYNDIIRAYEEKLNMFTIDLVGPFFTVLNSLGENSITINTFVDVAYEEKIAPNWSWIVGSVFRHGRTGYREIETYGGARYYYNMNRRILKGKSANNFSANYVSSALNYGRRFHTDDSQVTWNLGYGIQRRLGKRMFLDFTVGFENAFNAYTDRVTRTDLFVNFRYGLAF